MWLTGTSDGLIEQLRPIHPLSLRGTAGCETWSVDFSPGGSLFAWSMGYGVVKVLAWPLPNEYVEYVKWLAYTIQIPMF